MKLKKFFNWLAWLEHKDNGRAVFVLYTLIIIAFVLIFLTFWVISRNMTKAATIGFASSVGLGLLAGLTSNCFFSDPRKNWMIAIYEAEKIIKDYPEFIAGYPRYESKLREVLIPFTQKIKDPTDLNEFVATHKELFEARKRLAALQEQQKLFCDQIFESKMKIREL